MMAGQAGDGGLHVQSGISGEIMRLKAFQIEKYKTIADSGRVEVRPNVTLLLGKNEAGKSSVLQAIWKTHNVARVAYDALYDYPKERYTRDRGTDPIVATLEFGLDTDDEASLAKTVGGPVPTKIVVRTTYSGKQTCEVEMQVPAPDFADLQGVLADIDSGLGGEGQAPAEQVRAATQGVRKALATPTACQAIRESVSKLKAALAGSVVLPGELRERATTSIDAAGTFKSEQETKAAVDAWVLSNLPTFIYFEDYGRLETRINLTRFLQDRNASPPAPKVRTQMALFEWTKLKADELQRLGVGPQPNETIEQVQRRKEERATLLESASYSLTGDWVEWWDQREHQLHIGADGDDLVLKVSDSENPWRIDFQERSKGFQWFFSFYLTFLVESEKAHRGAILLLDEPGLHLHIRAQQRLLKLFERVSAKNQIIYSSHSPFLIDPDHLENVRTVFLKKGSNGDRLYTQVSPGEDPSGDYDTILPMQAVLGYELSQTLFLGKKTLIVEGITDYWLLKALGEELARRKRTFLPEEVVILFAGGASHMMPLVSLFIRPDDDSRCLVVLLDGDKTGLNKANQLRRDLLHKDRAVALISDPELLNQPNAQLEDVLEREELVEALARLGKKVLKRPSPEPPCNVDFLQAVYSANGWGTFTHEEKAALVLGVIEGWRKQTTEPAGKTLDRAEKILKDLQQRFQ
jgi:hypothetical protein